MAEAKTAGTKRAKSLAWRGKWNVMYIQIGVYKEVSPGYIGRPILKMYVPVRGSGVRADRIIDEIKKRHGVKPFVWTKK
jgi:hypothetical protein